MMLLRALGLTVGFVLSVSVAVLHITRESAPLPHNLVFIGVDARGWYDVFQLDLRSDQTRQLTDDAAIEANPQFTADGQHITYQYFDNTGNAFLAQLPVEGGAAIFKSELRFNRSMEDMSPDGQWSAYTIQQSHGGLTLYRQHVDSSNAEPVSYLNCAGWIDSMAWSPNGEWLAFWHRCFGQGHMLSNKLYRLHRDSDLPVLVYEAAPNRNLHLLDWSPDGEWLTFNMWNTRYSDVFRIHQNEAMPRQITDSPEINELWPVWSPDGEWIAFIRNEGTSDNIFRVRADGTDLERLTNTPTRKLELAWQPIVDLGWHVEALGVSGIALMLSALIWRRR